MAKQKNKRLLCPSKRIKKLIIIFIFVFGVFPFFVTILGNRTITSVVIDIGYLIRPLWDKELPMPPEKPHVYSPELSYESLCAMNGWSVYNNSGGRRKRRVVDVFTYAGEEDLLEIRIRELWDVVDLFIIAESALTFTGEQKPLYFKLPEQQKRFEFAMSKIKYVPVTTLRPLMKGESPFMNEGRLRRGASKAMRLYGKFSKDDLFVISDVDEIPYAHTLELLKTCTGYPNTVHLKLNTYRFSFEFPLPLQPVAKSSVNVVENEQSLSFTRIYRPGIILANSGWHCSWCFRTIEEVEHKMKSYSHADRGKRFIFFPSKKHIQKSLCSGDDVFELLPEAFTFKDLIKQLGPVKKSKDLSNVPKAVLDDPNKFGFLLPGNCTREVK